MIEEGDEVLVHEAGRNARDADVIVGAYGFENDATDEGSAYIYLGSSAGLSPQMG